MEGQDDPPPPPLPSPPPPPPDPHSVTHAQLLDFILHSQYSHEIVLHTLTQHHPEWLCTIPPDSDTATDKGTTPFHALVRTGNLRLLNMLLAESNHIPLDLAACDANGQSVKEVALSDEGRARHSAMARKIQELAEFEEAHKLASTLGQETCTQEEQEEQYDRLLEALSHKLDWISTFHHKAWSVLHHVVAHGDVSLLQRIVGLPNAFAKIQVKAQTKNCRRTLLQLAKDHVQKNQEMHDYLTHTLGPMFGVNSHIPVAATAKEGEGEGQGGKTATHTHTQQSAIFPRTRSVPVTNVKTVYFIRHAEGTHNEASRLYGEGEYKNWKWIDAELTNVGQKQCLQLKEKLLASRLMETLDLVVVSPLRRTLHTASLAFGIDEKEGKSPHLRPHIPRFVAMEAIRETAGLDPCNKRLSVSALSERFPHVDFSHVQCEDDVLYDEEKWESEESMEARGHYFLWWLSQRPERTVAVVTHGSFLMTLFERVLDAAGPWWENVEMRGLVVHFPATVASSLGGAALGVSGGGGVGNDGSNGGGDAIAAAEGDG